jgi:hypothetical protein
MSSISILPILGPLPFAMLTHRSAGDDSEFVVQKYFSGRSRAAYRKFYPHRSEKFSTPINALAASQAG